MAGIDSAGIGEVLQGVLAGFTDSEKGRLVKVRYILNWIDVPELMDGRVSRMSL